MLPDLLLALVALASAAVIGAQLIGASSAQDRHRTDGDLVAMRKRKERVLRALKDIEVEHEVGTLSDEEFQRLRIDFKRRAVAAMKALEQARASRLRRIRRRGSSVPPSLRRRVENLIAERKESA